MSLLKIHTVGAPVLRVKAKPFRRFDAGTRRLVADMIETMRDAPGVGLAAPQVGISERLIVVEYEETVYVLANPETVSRSEEKVLGEEGCLSIPDLYGDVERAERVTIRGLDESNKRTKIEAEGWLARIFQHEIDHLDGVLFTDRMEPDAELRRVRNSSAEEEI